MALQKITKDGYGQLELNLVAFPRDGRVVAQYKAGTTFTAEGVTGDDRYLENGMLLKVDGANRCVDKANPAAGDIFALNYFDMGDLAVMIAPKKLVVVCGKDDDIFPLHGVKETFGIIETLYKASDAPDGCALVVGDGGHRFYADDAWPVMKGLLSKR